VEPVNNIDAWRRTIFRSLLNFVLVFGVITAVPSIVAAMVRDMWPVVAVDVTALAWLGAIWLHKRASYTVRVLNFLGIVYLVGVGLMVTLGPISQVYLLGGPVLATVLLGMWPALGALALASASIFVLNYLGFARLNLDGLADHTLLTSSVLTLNFLFVGAIITVSCAILLRGLSKSLKRLGVFAQSLEQRKNELQALNGELRLTAAAVARLNDLVAIARVGDNGSAAQPIIFVNDAFEQRTGYRRDEVLGKHWDFLLGADPAAPEARRVARAIAQMESVTAELRYLTRTGEPYWVEIELVPFADEGGVNTHWVAVGRDITERRKSEQRIHQLAFFDVLTGLPNRRLLTDRIDTLLEETRGDASFGALLFVDLDRFKYINDARGHGVGDAVLRHAAERLSRFAGEHNTVARIGGDEFVVLLAGLGNDRERATAAALASADRIRRAIAGDLEIEAQSYASSASIGVSMLPKPGQTAQDLLREADTAMYRAKLAGRNQVALFEATMLAEVEQRLSLERDLAAALEKGGLTAHLQLQVDRNGIPSGAELLARWRNGERDVPPDLFIPIAEECGLIVALGEWVLREACIGLKRLAQAGYSLPLSVNVSPSQFRQPDFVALVRAVLAETGAPASALVFEVTEGLFIEDVEGTLARMHELSALGIRLSVDDFGTGYSNLAYLKRMPLYELKIDRSFIRDTPSDASGTAIVQSVLSMAGHLGLRTIAEGVETQEQAAFLAANGVSGMQGYLFARPMPLEDMIGLLDASPAGFAIAGSGHDALAATA
jgi:diguanylate cyclase (GGDEF)-like protein/PAS domain S-box-containing protein